MYLTLSVELVTCHGAWSWQFMWWYQVALGLELIWFGFKCSQVASSDMILLLSCFHVTSPKPYLWPILFFCNAKDYQMVKPFLSSIKTVALVQGGLWIKKGSHFIVAKNWSNQFCKIQNNARCEVLVLMEFLPLYFILKNSKCTLFCWERVLFAFWFFFSASQNCPTNFGWSRVLQGIFKNVVSYF